MKKKVKLKRVWVVILIIIVLLLAYPSILTYRIVSKNYSFNSVFDIVFKGIKDEVLANNYSRTVEVAVGSEDFVKENVTSYFAIDYVDKNDFIKRINTLLKVGYTTDNINLINNKMTDDIVLSLYDHDLIEDIDKYLEFDFFKSENLYRYLDYFTGDYKDTVVAVNIGLDKPLYEDAKIVTQFSETVLANKYNKLDETFEPVNITAIKSSCTKGTSTQYLSKVAQVAFEKMCDDALKDNMHILANSAYRSYDSQVEVYDTYLNLYGQDYVDNYVALPGYSEHQTGLALDVASRDYNTFKSSPEYTWMLNNAYKYGFILRYQEDKQDITGYKYEAWHFRYVGEEIAKYIKENNITYEEYYVMFLDK